MDSSDEGLIYGLRADGKGGGDGVTLNDAADRSGAFVWLHLDRMSDASRRWAKESANLPDEVIEALFTDETRPRATEIGNGLLINLRGVNLNAGAMPDDMLSVRLWVERDRIISTRRYRIRAVEDVRHLFEAGEGPGSVSAFVSTLADRLAERMFPSILVLDEDLDTIEDEMLQHGVPATRSKLRELRRRAISYRRFIGPQREALSFLYSGRAALIDPHARDRLREVADRTSRMVEDLDAARERSAILHDEIQTRLSEEINRTLYVLSIVAAVFLPLGFLTGLLGINVGGVPGVDNPLAFAIVSVALVLVAIAEVWLFRRLGWIQPKGEVALVSPDDSPASTSPRGSS